MKIGKLTTDANGYGRYTFNEGDTIPVTQTRRVGIATVHQETATDGIYSVYVTKITDEYIEFKTTRTEVAEGLLGAVLSLFIKPSSNHSCTVGFIVHYDDNPN